MVHFPSLGVFWASGSLSADGFLASAGSLLRLGFLGNHGSFFFNKSSLFLQA